MDTDLTEKIEGLGEFQYSYGSSEWLTDYVKFRSVYSLPEYQDARLSKLCNGLPKNLKLYRHIRGLSIAKKTLKYDLAILDCMSKQDSILNESLETTELLFKNIENMRDFIPTLESHIGKVVGDAICSEKGISREIANIERHLKQTPEIGDLSPLDYPLPKRDSQRDMLPARILQSLEDLRVKWFGESSLVMWMITKAALKEHVFSGNPITDKEEKEFRKLLGAMGLKNLPERTRRGKKRS